MTTNPRKRTAETQEEAWVADEDRFVLAQAKKRALLRVKAGRGRPIDLLAVALRGIETTESGLEEEDGDDDENLLVNPETVFDGLGRTDLEELEREVETYLALEKTRVSYEYWKTLKIVCRDRRRVSDEIAGSDVEPVAKSLDKILEPKNLSQLEVLEKQIQQKLKGREEIDVDYWENLLKRLAVHKARAQLRSISQQVQSSRMSKLKEEQTRHAKAFAERMAAKLQAMNTTEAKRISLDTLDPEPALRIGPLDQQIPVVDQSKFDEIAKREKHRVAQAGYIAERSHRPSEHRDAIERAGNGPSRSTAYDREVARGLEEDEEVLTTEETATQSRRPAWADQYPPRKPRYFNRVQLGYEWNKYNQTHYDQDNPPPKVVQGYKFNIFYPDLIDNTKAPTYRIEREGGRKRGQTLAPAGEEDTCLIRFIAGAPYDEVTFRIVDREWDYSARRERGFRSSFDKGILQLHFQFKKVYYRK